MKEENIRTESLDGKFRGNSPRLKNRSSSFADSAINAIGSVSPSSYEATAKFVSESTTELINMAGANAKKAYAYMSKHKYQTLGVIGAAGLAGAGYFWLSKRGVTKATSKVSKAKSASKKR